MKKAKESLIEFLMFAALLVIITQVIVAALMNYIAIIALVLGGLFLLAVAYFVLRILYRRRSF